MATVQELEALERAYARATESAQERVSAIVRQTNASGKPQWTEDLRAQKQQAEAEVKPLANRRWHLHRLQEARLFVLHLTDDRREYAGELGVNYSYVNADVNWPVTGDRDTANAAFLREHNLPANFAECVAQGDSGRNETLLARYLEARDLDVQAEYAALGM